MTEEPLRRKSPLRRLLGWTPLVLCLALGISLAAGWLGIPPPYNPFAPLDIKAAPTPVTWLKLLRLDHDPAACFAALGTGDLDFTILADRPSSNGCDLAGTVRVRQSSIAFNRSFIATCPLAVSLALFERHALQPAAERHLGTNVARLDHVGTYACRNVYGRNRGRRSEHATANAIDVTAFALADGRRVSVAGGWKSGQVGAFLRDVRDGACRFFDTVLSPDYNAAHSDHLHLDMGTFQACR